MTEDLMRAQDVLMRAVFKASVKPKPRRDPLTDPRPLAPTASGEMDPVERELDGYYTQEQFQAVVEALEECRSRMAEMHRHIEYFLSVVDGITLISENEQIQFRSALGGLKTVANELLKETDL